MTGDRNAPLHRFSAGRQRQRRRIAIVLIVSLVLPLTGLGLWALWVRFIG